MLSLKIQTALTDISGWCNQDKAEVFASHLSSMHSPLCVEIGVFSGRSLIILGLLLKEKGRGMAVGIDNWSKTAIVEGNESKDMKWYLDKDLEAIYQKCLTYVMDYEVEDHCAVLRLDSNRGADIFGYESIDLLHIDGNHSEKVSCRDVELFLPKVKRRGVIVFDDINWGTTKKAQAILARNCTLNYQTSHFAAYIKN